jgi:hypothetical protein
VATALGKQVQKSVFSIQEAKEVIKLASTSGRVGGWGLLGSSAGLTVALALSATALQIPIFGAIGLFAGVGLYAARVFARIGSPDMDDVSTKLRDLKTMYVAGELEEDEHKAARAKLLKRAGLI